MEAMILNLVASIMDMLPPMSINIDDVSFSQILNFLRLINFIIPVSEMVRILGIIIGIKSLQIMWAVVLRVKSFIPTMGA